MWTQCALQTFFQGIHIKYFEVNLEVHQKADWNASMDSTLEEADKRDEEWRLSLNEIKETDIVTKSPWLNRTRWEKTFLGQDMKALIQLTEKPGDNEYEIIEIWKSVSRVIEKCWKGVDDIFDRNWDLILFWLNSPIIGKANSKPFRLDKRDKTVQR